MYLKDLINFIEENKNMINLDTCRIKLSFEIKKQCKIDNGDILIYNREEPNIVQILDQMESSIENSISILREKLSA